MADDLRQRYAEALAAAYTRSVPRCDKWGENEWVENPEPADRVEQTVSVIYEASDGHPAIRFPTCMEVAEVVVAVRDEELERLRAEHATQADSIRSYQADIRDRWNPMEQEVEQLRQAARIVTESRWYERLAQAEQWRERAEKAERRLAAVQQLADEWGEPVHCSWMSASVLVRQLRNALDDQEADRG